jgi:hypothetical protein
MSTASKPTISSSTGSGTGSGSVSGPGPSRVTIPTSSHLNGSSIANVDLMSTASKPKIISSSVSVFAPGRGRVTNPTSSHLNGSSSSVANIDLMSLVSTQNLGSFHAHGRVSNYFASSSRGNSAIRSSNKFMSQLETTIGPLGRNPKTINEYIIPANFDYDVVSDDFFNEICDI